MINLKEIGFGIIIFCCSIPLVSSQEINTNDLSSELGANERVESYNILEALMFSNVNLPTPKNPQIPGNNVFITQVGVGNAINTNISSPDAVVNLAQYGNRNNINMSIKADRIEQNILQNGNNNSFFEFVVSPSNPVDFNLIQEGNNIHVENYGSNSISNKLELNITGNSKTFIMRNFQ